LPSRLLRSSAHTNGLPTKCPKSCSYLTQMSAKNNPNTGFISDRKESQHLEVTAVVSSHHPSFFPSSHEGSLLQLRHRQVGGTRRGQSGRVTSTTSQNDRVEIRTGKQYKSIHLLKRQISYSKECGVISGKTTHIHIKL